MARVIWNRRENPSDYVSDKLRITREQLGDAIHEIKAAGNLSPADRIINMMTARSWMSTAMPSATSTTKSDNTTRAFATLRFAGDALDPDEISRVIREKPTRAYRKGQTYRSGPHGPEITGKTGVWYFSTRRKIPSKDLSDHVDALVGLIFPFGDQDKRLRELRDIMERENLKAYATFFWRGPSDAKRPSVSHVATEPLNRLPADIEVDFETE